jgi:hypothetical protein
VRSLSLCRPNYPTHHRSSLSQRAWARRRSDARKEKRVFAAATRIKCANEHSLDAALFLCGNEGDETSAIVLARSLFACTPLIETRSWHVVVLAIRNPGASLALRNA